MPRAAEDKRAGLIESLVDYARAKLKAEHTAQAETFLRHYYSDADADDLSERSLPDLYGAALAHLNFARRFTPGAGACPAAAGKGRRGEIQLAGGGAEGDAAAGEGPS